MFVINLLTKFNKLNFLIIYYSVLGHEAVAEVVETRRKEYDIKVGDRITFSVADSCQTCYQCQYNLPQKCSKVSKVVVHFQFSVPQIKYPLGGSSKNASHVYFLLVVAIRTTFISNNSIMITKLNDCW